ncbi:MAG TPA: hypothetical protein DHW14_07835, partial [Clostridiales bacterium]|nr:hypothetical protein [Clostridiales bacterium]
MGLQACGPPPLSVEFVDHPEELVAQVRGGSLHTVGGLTVVRVSGGPYERGRQYGTLLKDEIAEMPAFLVSGLEHLPGRDPEVIYGKALALAAHLPEEYLEEVRGVADGAGLSYEDALFVNLYFEALLATPLSSERGSGCSQFVAVPALTGNGVIHGRNVDLDHLTAEETAFLQDHSVVLVITPDDGIPHAHLTFSGMTCVLTGVNEEGLVFALNALMGAETLESGLPVSYLGREVLARFAARAEARAYLEETQVLSGIIAVLSDRTGGTVVEVMPHGAGDPELRLFRDTVDGWVAATNHSTAGTGHSDSVTRYSLLVERLEKAALAGAGSNTVSVIEAVRL